MTHPEEKIQRILNRTKRESFLSTREVDGQIVELLSFCDDLTTAATEPRLSSSPPPSPGSNTHANKRPHLLQEIVCCTSNSMLTATGQV